MLGTPCPLARVQWLLLDDGSCLFASRFVIASLRALLAVAFFGGRPSTASFAGGLGAEGPAAADPASCLFFSFFSFFSSFSSFSSFFWRARRAAFPGGFSAFALLQTQSLARPPNRHRAPLARAAHGGNGPAPVLSGPTGLFYRTLLGYFIGPYPGVCGLCGLCGKIGPSGALFSDRPGLVYRALARLRGVLAPLFSSAPRQEVPVTAN